MSIAVDELPAADEKRRSPPLVGERTDGVRGHPFEKIPREQHDDHGNDGVEGVHQHQNLPPRGSIGAWFRASVTFNARPPISLPFSPSIAAFASSIVV